MPDTPVPPGVGYAIKVKSQPSRCIDGPKVPLARRAVRYNMILLGSEGRFSTP